MSETQEQHNVGLPPGTEGSSWADLFEGSVTDPNAQPQGQPTQQAQEGAENSDPTKQESVFDVPLPNSPVREAEAKMPPSPNEETAQRGVDNLPQTPQEDATTALLQNVAKRGLPRQALTSEKPPDARAIIPEPQRTDFADDGAYQKAMDNYDKQIRYFDDNIKVMEARAAHSSFELVAKQVLAELGKGYDAAIKAGAINQANLIEEIMFGVAYTEGDHKADLVNMVATSSPQEAALRLVKARLPEIRPEPSSPRADAQARAQVAQQLGQQRQRTGLMTARVGQTHPLDEANAFVEAQAKRPQV